MRSCVAGLEAAADAGLGQGLKPCGRRRRLRLPTRGTLRAAGSEGVSAPASRRLRERERGKERQGSERTGHGELAADDDDGGDGHEPGELGGEAGVGRVGGEEHEGGGDHELWEERREGGELTGRWREGRKGGREGGERASLVRDGVEESAEGGGELHLPAGGGAGESGNFVGR